jgi:hypothetical protein
MPRQQSSHPKMGALNRCLVPADDQRVPHIWPSFGQMAETRTSIRPQLIQTAKPESGCCPARALSLAFPGANPHR